jgi:PAS domain S-box-containing protein
MNGDNDPTAAASERRCREKPRWSLVHFSVRGREILALSVLTLSVVVLTTVLHLVHARQIAWADMRRETELVAREIHSQAARALLRQAGVGPRVALARDKELRSLLDLSVGYAPWLLYALIADDKGVAIVHSDRRLEGHHMPPAPALQERIPGLSPALGISGGVRSPEIYEVTLPLSLDERPFATIRLGIAVPLLRSQLDDVFWYTVILGAVALAAALGVALVLSNVTLKPIRRLAQDMERLRSGEFDVGSAAGPKDEFGKLAYQLQLLGKQIQSDRTRVLTEQTQMQAVVDQLEDGLVFFDGDGRILFANRAAEPALGRPAREVTGSRIDEVLGEQHPLWPIIRRALQEHLGSQSVRIEVPTNGASFELLVSAFPVADDQSRAHSRVILTTRDIKSVAVSARTFQAIIQYSAQLAALGQVTSEVTHDVKNPLHAMMVHVAFLKERLLDGPPDVASSLNILESEIRRADAVLNRFSEVVRPSEVALKPVDLNAMLEEIGGLLQTEWQPKNVSLSFRLDQSVPAIPGDEEMLRRAFVNLIVNACQAMPEGGTVTIDTALEDGLLKATVSDTGVGIPSEDLERIFKMYYTTKAEGTGIGLSLVKRVVELHHGSIEILSTVGQGTNIIVRLPIKAAE